MQDAFFQPGDDCGDAYRNLRDLGYNSNRREFVECLWARFRPSPDNHFLTEAKTSFLQRFWEMYLFAALEDQGLQPQKGAGAGPDLLVVFGGVRYWIEAVAPRRGDGADQVPEMDWGSKEARRSPLDQIQLRYANAISEKAGKWARWIQVGRVLAGDGYLIALNGRGCNEFFDGNPPLFVRACVAIGHPSMALDPVTGKIVDAYYTYSDSITKKSGVPVSTAAFFQPEFSHVSGVIHSLADGWHHPASLLEGMEFLHNPQADVPLLRSALRGFRQFTVSDQGLTTIPPDPPWPEREDVLID